MTEQVAIPTIQELAAMKKELDVVSEKIATAKGTFAALTAQRLNYEEQLRALGVDPANSAEVLGTRKAEIIKKNALVQTSMLEIKEALAKAEVTY